MYRSGFHVMTYYHFDPRKWDDTSQSLVMADAEKNERIEAMGLYLYMFHVDEAKANFRAEETENRFNIKGYENDWRTTGIINEII